MNPTETGHRHAAPAVAGTDGAAPPASPASAQPFLRTEKLGLAYGSKPAFADVSLAIPSRAITALIGPSGCGKTSFLNCLNRLTDLIPSARATGRITVGDLEVLDPRTDVLALRRRIGMIFQKPNPFPLSVRTNLEFPLREHGIRNRAELRQIVETTLQEVGLWNEMKDRLETSALALSGGQQQRLCLARALALRPEALLMDEPCSALDPLSSGVVEELIARLRERYTILIVTHNLAQARRIADHAAVFWVADGCGRLIEHGLARQVFENPRETLTAAYVTGRSG